MKTNLKTVLFLAGLLSIVSVPCASAHTDVTAEEAKELIDTMEDLTVVDVREPYEYNSTIGHIPGALNYPWNSGVLKADYEELPADGPILVVCGSGSRSNRAANFLDSKDFSMVYDMLGGMSAWKWETETDVDPDSKYGGGTGEPNDPYLIYTAGQLNAIGAEPDDWDKHFMLMADIDLSVYTGADFNIIGNPAWPFTGVFDGNGKKISNFSYTSTDVNNVGLFRCVNGEKALIKKLGLIDPNIDGGTPKGEKFTGSLVGKLEGGTVTNCYVEYGIVIGESNVGGLVGYNEGIINNCYSSIEMSCDLIVGGLVGINLGTITNCYSSSNISGDWTVGGLVAVNEGTIMDCYSIGGVWGATDIGGLVGWNNSTITNCYAAGSVAGTMNVGGLAGTNRESIVISYWDIEISGQTTSDGGTGKTTAEMQTAGTFLEAGWDFVGETENGTDDIWSICEGTNYPRFVWQIPVGDFVCPDGITMYDFLFLLEFWLNDDCDSSNDFCQGTDLDQSGTVDEDDLEIFFELWLTEK